MVNGLGLNKSDAAWAGDDSVVDNNAAVVRDDVTHRKRTRLLSTVKGDVVFVVLIGSSWWSRVFRRRVPTLECCVNTTDVERGWVNANAADSRELPHRAANKTEVFILRVCLACMQHVALCSGGLLLGCFVGPAESVSPPLEFVVKIPRFSLAANP